MGSTYKEYQDEYNKVGNGKMSDNSMGLQIVEEKKLATLDDMRVMAGALGPLFKKTESQMLALMLIAQAEGLHPASAAQEYDIIDGRPAINSRSALSRFQKSGGKVEYKERSDSKCVADFSHPQAESVTITWTIEQAQKIGLTSKDNWKKYPRAMLSARCVAEGIRACFPACLSGMYTVEEVQDFPEMRDANIQPPSENAKFRAETISYIASVASQLNELIVKQVKQELKEAKDDMVKLQELRDKVEKYISSDPAIVMTADDEQGASDAFDGKVE